jgi:hypothetical protein
MSNNKQQTAVEWLFSYMFNPSHPHEEQFKLLEEAKEMEKWQIKETASAYYHENTKLTPTQYYEQTYGGDKL